MSFTINSVTVRLGRDPEDFRRYQITVQVHSKTRPGLRSDVTIDPASVKTKQELLNKIGYAGGAGAEYLGGHYGDNIDPSNAARDAIKAFGEECYLLESLGASSVDKVKRLEQHLAKLSSAEVELLHKLRWAVDQGQKLMPAEHQWIDQRVHSLHQG